MHLSKRLSVAVAMLEGGSQPFRPGRDAAWRDPALKRWGHAVETVRRHYRPDGGLGIL